MSQRYYLRKHRFSKDEIRDKICHRTLDKNETIKTLNRFYEEHKQLKPIREICRKYNIKLEDLPDTLEEYIEYDNAEYLEKLQNQ